ncbi:MAG: DUF5131 family protein [Bacillota bacterium]|nr:DUF5131 family protein [Bacillota bacterium]MDD3298309.1 DUF5131 family protein [Bacillota bacterium]MDD3850343.1 DUF5131 family protein [Bacillota bacterium]MDD4707015.1 DUF5131 family protein [Bacillota bacterium]
MKKFVIEDGFWGLFPGAKIGVAVCRGIDNSTKDTEVYEKMLRQVEREAVGYFKEEVFSSNPVIAVWRNAFKKFKTKKGARSSIEALLKRVQKGGQIGTINPLVDIYNSVSLRYALPCGGESGNNARVCDYEWVLSTRQQCIEYDVPFSFRQTGANFRKGNRTYRIKRKYQMSQAAKAGIDYK